MTRTAEHTQQSGSTRKGRILRSHWFVPAFTFLAAPLAFLFLSDLDQALLTSWLMDHDLAPAKNGGSASETIAAVVGILAAYLTLYLSISLLVMTIAASNLGVRLIDRWLGSRWARSTIATLGFSLIFAVLTLAAIDADATASDSPLGLVAICLVLFVVASIVLAASLHELGRTMFVDREIALLGDDGQDALPPLYAKAPLPAPAGQTVAAPSAGYIGFVDVKALVQTLAGHPGRVRLCAAPGQHVLAGQSLMMLEHNYEASGDLLKSIPIGPFRNDAEGVAFRIRLLVEIAARALSPAVNDFYSALAAVDSLGRVLCAQSGRWIDEDKVAALVSHSEFEVVGQDLAALFTHPLSSLRQAAASYPSVAIRLIETYAQVAATAAAEPGFASYLRRQAAELADHAAAAAEYDGDCRAIRAAYEAGFATVFTSASPLAR